MNDREKSDNPIGFERSPNNPNFPGAEAAEKRGLAEGNPSQADMSRTQSRNGDVPSGLERIRQAARRDRDLSFTALLHHVTVDRLGEAFERVNPRATPGVDQVTYERYKVNLQENLEALHRSVHTGAYRAKPSRRAYIPKPDGGQRPLGIASLEDKVVQGAVAEVLNAIYEEDFLGFSYGFRRGKNPHGALDALAYGIVRKKVNWVLDADIRGYFDSIDHEMLLRYVERRIGDPRVLRLIRKWLKAGVLEEDELRTSSQGTPQGATISPLLSNVYLHYVFDTWAHQWRQRFARGEVVLVRYADDFVVGFEQKDDAERFQRALGEQLARYRLELHPEKTRLIEFGRYASRDRSRRGEGKPETFDFLGFTHICGKTRGGKFLLRRHTIAKRLRNKLKALRCELRKRMHDPAEMTAVWLRAVLQGYYNYFAVPTNRGRLSSFRYEVCKAWMALLRRRSQKHRLTWEKMTPLFDRWLPSPEYCHPFPEQRMQARLTRGRSRMR